MRLFSFWSLLVSLIHAYQLLISPLLGGVACRYYPRCSEFALWHLKARTNVVCLFIAVLYRIVRCNPFCAGGIDYPVVWRYEHDICRLSPNCHHNIQFWLVPRGRHRFFGKPIQSFYLIKSQYKGGLCV